MERTPIQMTVEQVEAHAAALENKSVDDVIAWALETFGDELGMMTALGYSGVVLMHHLLKHRPEMEVYFIDTGFHFPETLEFLDRLRDEWGVNFVVLRPRMSDEELHEEMGPEPWAANPDLCCHHRKVEPLIREIHRKSAWLSSIRRDQSVTRAGIDTVEIDGRGVIKVYPLAAWTSEQTWDYIRKHNLPYHPLHDRGYPSVGCQPCTQPIKPGEHERTGRWNSMPKLECGIHLHNKKPKPTDG